MVSLYFTQFDITVYAMNFLFSLEAFFFFVEINNYRKDVVIKTLAMFNTDNGIIKLDH